MSELKNRYHTDLILSNLLYGVNFSFFVSLTQHWMPFKDLFFLQVAVSALFFIPFAIFSKKSYRMTLPDMAKILLVTVIIIYGGMYMMLWGAKYTNPIDASIIATLGPAFTLITAAILVDSKITFVKAIGVVLSRIGAAILLFYKGNVMVHGSEAFGNMLVLLSVIAVAVNTVIIKPILVKYGTLVVMGWYYIIGLIITAPFFAKQALNTEYLSLPVTAIGEILYILVLGTLLPSYLLYRGTEKLTAVHTALYRYIQPLVATGLALYRGQETLHRTNYIAAAFIFVGVILVAAAYRGVFDKIKALIEKRRGTHSA